MTTSKRRRPETMAIHAGLEAPLEHGPVSVPIYQSATFRFSEADEGAARFAGRDPGYIYTRLGNPTVRALCASTNTTVCTRKPRWALRDGPPKSPSAAAAPCP